MSIFKQLFQRSPKSPAIEQETSEKEMGAVFVFNYNEALKTQFNPQRYFCQSILKSFCPRSRSCPRQVQPAFYELRVSPVDSSIWGTLDSFTRSGKHYLRSGTSKAEHDFITSVNTRQLGFTPYIVAVWSDCASAFDHMHRWLMESNTDGYVGYTTLEILTTIEEFHRMCREVDLGWDAVVKDGEYYYPRGSDHPLKPDVMSEMGFSPADTKETSR